MLDNTEMAIYTLFTKNSEKLCTIRAEHLLCDWNRQVYYLPIHEAGEGYDKFPWSGGGGQLCEIRGSNFPSAVGCDTMCIQRIMVSNFSFLNGFHELVETIGKSKDKNFNNFFLQEDVFSNGMPTWHTMCILQ